MKRIAAGAVTTALGLFLSGGLWASPPTAAPEAEATRARPLAGKRLDTMRALARYLDETAQGAMEGAADDVRRGSPADARFLSAVRSFAKSAHGLSRTAVECRTACRDLPGQVASLAQRSRLMGEEMRTAGALQSISDEWEAMADVLRRMALLLDGHDVEVPASYVVPALTGARLAQLRRLATDLDDSATRTHGKAARAVGKYRERGQQFMGELRHFALQGRDLRLRTDVPKVDPQDVGPLVDQLLGEAREADRRMRDAQVFTEVWDDSARTITILQRMANLVRS